LCICNLRWTGISQQAINAIELHTMIPKHSRGSCWFSRPYIYRV